MKSAKLAVKLPQTTRVRQAVWAILNYRIAEAVSDLDGLKLQRGLSNADRRVIPTDNRLPAVDSDVNAELTFPSSVEVQRECGSVL